MRSTWVSPGRWAMRQKAWGVFWNPPTLWRVVMLRQSDGARVQGLEPLHWPEGLAHLVATPGSWSAPFLPPHPWPFARPRLGVALAQSLCQQGDALLAPDTPWPEACVRAQWQAAQALGVGAQAVAFDLHLHPDGRLAWVACAQAHTQPWQRQARQQGWHLHRAEPEAQAAARALAHWRADPHTAWARPAQDWRFDLQPQAHDPALLPTLQATPAWPALVATGAALGVWA